MTRLIARQAAVTGGEIHCRVSLSAPGRPILLLQAVGAEVDDLTPFAERLAPHRAVILPDLPGQGSTGLLRERPVTVAEHASRLAEACRDLGVPRADVLGAGLGAVVAAELAYQHAAMIGHLVLIDTPLYSTSQRTARHAALATATTSDAAFARAYLDYDLARTLAALRLRVRYYARRGGGFESMTDHAARLTGALPGELPGSCLDWPLDLVPAS